MNVRLPSLRQLQYLLALHEHGHFGRAAQTTNVTQSTLSAGLIELEALLGVTLVERSRRVVRFTPLGEDVAAKAGALLRAAEDLTVMTRAAGQPLAGELRMGVIPTIAPFLLPRVLPGLRRDWPDLKLFLREETTPLACDSLQRGRLDCVLLALPYACGAIDSIAIAQDRLHVAVPAAQAARGASIAAVDIDPAQLLLMEDGHCLQDHALAACARPELRGQATMLGTSLHTLVQMVDNGLGVTLLPQMALDAGILNGTKVVALPLAAREASRTIALAWRQESPRGPEFRLLAEALKAAIRPAAARGGTKLPARAYPD